MALLFTVIEEAVVATVLIPLLLSSQVVADLAETQRTQRSTEAAQALEEVRDLGRDLEGVFVKVPLDPGQDLDGAIKRSVTRTDEITRVAVAEMPRGTPVVLILDPLGTDETRARMREWFICFYLLAIAWSGAPHLARADGKALFQALKEKSAGWLLSRLR